MSEVRDDEWVGTKVLFENDRVRVWDFQLDPGESTSMHTHRRDFLYVYVTEDNLLRIDYPGAPSADFERPDGHVSFNEMANIPEARHTHKATNIGTKRHRQILIEFFGDSSKT